MYVTYEVIKKGSLKCDMKFCEQFRHYRVALCWRHWPVSGVSVCAMFERFFAKCFVVLPRNPSQRIGELTNLEHKRSFQLVDSTKSDRRNKKSNSATSSFVKVINQNL